MKVTNGGLHDPYLAFAYYLDLKKSNPDSAKVFMAKYFNATMKGAASNSNSGFWAYYNGSDSLYQSYKLLGIDYPNFHMKEEGDGRFIDYPYVKALNDYVKKTMGKKLISGEIGLRIKDNPTSVQRMQSAFRLCRIPIQNWFSGREDTSIPLEVNGKLNTDGVLYKNYLISIQ